MRACRNILTFALALGLMISATLGVRAQETETPSVGDPGIIAAENGAGEQPPLGASEQELTGGSVLALLLPEADENTVYNEQQLMDWYAANSGTGGTVSLGCSITITQGNFEFNWYESNNRVTIDTGEFGLIYDGGALSTGEFILTGEGVDNPVLTVIDPGVFMASWVHGVQGLSVTATGKDGAGGTAVYVQSEPGYFWNWRPMYTFFNVEGSIYSYGTGAVGLELEGPMDVYCLNIQVEGKNSAAVSAPEGAALYYCKLSASGSGAAAVRGGDILLDTCAASPAAQRGNITVLQRRIVGLSGSRFYLPVPLNSNSAPYESYIQFLTELADGTLAAQTFFVAWDLDAINAIDLDKPGRTTIPGRFPPPFEGLSLTGSLPFALELVIDVRDPLLPTISDIQMHDLDDEGKYVCFGFWESDAWEVGDLILWRSDDGGATWYDYSDSDDIKWDYRRYEFYFYYDEITDPVFFQLEAPGYGESNIVTLYATDTGASTGDGGDRTGADRIIGTKPGEDTPTGGGDHSDDETGTGDDGGTQPGDESGSGDNGNANGGGSSDDGTPDNGTGTGGNGGTQPGDETGSGDNGNANGGGGSDGGTHGNGTGTGGDGGTQPGDESGSGDNGNANGGGGSDSGTPGNGTGTGGGSGTGQVDGNTPLAENITVNTPQVQKEEANSAITPANTDSLFSTPVLAAVPDAPVFASDDHTGQDGTATGESPSTSADATADSPGAAEETNTARAQPSIPNPAFPIGAAMALTGSGVILLAGLSVWIKARRLRGR